MCALLFSCVCVCVYVFVFLFVIDGVTLHGSFLACVFCCACVYGCVRVVVVVLRRLWILFAIYCVVL